MERSLENRSERRLEKRMGVEERRRHRRYKATAGVFAVNSKFGQIIDISRGGLSFRYVERRGWPKELFEMGVLYGDDDFCLDSLAIRTISDCVVANGLSSSSTIIRRCGVEFATLTPKQLRDLEYFIWANSDGEPDQFLAD